MNECATDQFTANTGIEFFDRTPVRMCCHGTVRGLVRSTIKGVDRLRKAELRRRHSCMRGRVASARGPEAGKARKHTAHRV